MGFAISEGGLLNLSEKYFQGRVAGIGCISCLLDGRENPYVSIHHIWGRVGKRRHYMVLPLCRPHHQGEIEARKLGYVSVHPDKARFESIYGEQEHLLVLVNAILDGVLSRRDLISIHQDTFMSGVPNVD